MCLQGKNHKTIENTLEDFHDKKSNQLICEILKIIIKEIAIQHCIEKKKVGFLILKQYKNN